MNAQRGDVNASILLRPSKNVSNWELGGNLHARGEAPCKLIPPLWVDKFSLEDRKFTKGS